MDFFLTLDESGHLHSKSAGRYFVIGGVLCDNPSLTKITKKFKKANLKLKKQKNINIKQELKGTDLKTSDKHFLLREIEKIEDVKYVFVVVDKKQVQKGNLNSVNLFYNYAINILIECLYNRGLIPKETETLKINLDNRTIKISSQNSLEDYLNIKFKIEKQNPVNFNIRCKYSDSKFDYSIEVADLLCNVCWTKFNYPQTDKVSLYLNNKSFFAYFPINSFGL
ncbi:DUF3800 domain-containing protein [Fusobacterium gastrosuis]|uniref:DUF3800 domain-containing protein n=1 Tax=Fusobacterium gastrosuis TaxID=1755100 RepID=UPI0029756D6C|nr:DUF3800 domain-containing protein [Fusobacteriaceae bacterium]MDY5713658.1 DUF3800 domain-containing protein [Fusobacterium gastrosuis]